MERRRLLTLATHADSPGQRFRILTWERYFARIGIINENRAFATPKLEALLKADGRTLEKAWQTAKSLARYPLVLPRLSAYDAVLVYREAAPLGPPVVERSIARQRIPFAYDIDDPIFLPAPARGRLARLVRDEGKWKTICGLADVTICINEMIADAVRRHARRVEVVPNAIDLARYSPKRHATSARPVLGYSGSHSTMFLLADIAPALRRVARDHPILLHVVGGRAPAEVRDVPHEERPWSAERESDILAGFDVGLAPAPDDAWNRHKSFVKVLLYMAVGLPVVAAPVGLPRVLIRDGENGFLASREDEWVEKLLLLVRDTDLRARVGAAARATIERSYDLAKELPKTAAIFESLMDGGR